MPTPVAAANAYANLARLTGSGGGLTKVLGDPPAGPSFDALVKEALATVVEAGRKSDTQAQAARPTWSTSSPRLPRARPRSRRWSRCATA